MYLYSDLNFVVYLKVEIPLVYDYTIDKDLNKVGIYSSIDYVSESGSDWESPFISCAHELQNSTKLSIKFDPDLLSGSSYSLNVN